MSFKLFPYFSNVYVFKLQKVSLNIICLIICLLNHNMSPKDKVIFLHQFGKHSEFNSTSISLNLCLRSDSKVQQTKSSFNIHIQGHSKGHAPQKTTEYIDGDYGGYSFL